MGTIDNINSNITTFEGLSKMFINEFKEQIHEDFEPIDTYAIYNDMLNETCPHDLPAFMEQDYAQSMKENSPTDYNCGYVDWLDGYITDNTPYEIDDEYYHKHEVEDIKEEMLDGIRDEIEEILSKYLGE